MRIITGKAKGLKLKSPKGMATRPTSDRIKESLFSILNGMIDFNGKKILDLFAGTGALALEALSRGGAHAVFIDSDTVKIISENVNNAKFVNESEIIRSDVFKALNKFANSQRQFDIIFCDPPYNKGLWQRVLTEVDNLNLLTADGLLIIEHGADEVNEIKLCNIEPLRQIKYGHTTAIEIYATKNAGVTDA